MVGNQEEKLLHKINGNSTHPEHEQTRELVCFHLSEQVVRGPEKLGSKYTFIASIKNLDERHAVNLEKVRVIIAD
jgi:hypothetical protein